MKPKKKLIIIGAGLSGLYLATLLKEDFDITILEARNRLGGRILTHEEHDLGPSWIWPHQKHILSLVNKLKLELFAQYTKGDALYDAPNGVQSFNAPPSAPSARMKGGLGNLIKTLANSLPSTMIQKNEKVLNINEENETLTVQTQHKQYKAAYVISTLPPRLACKNISYEPKLEEKSKQEMQDTPTWMGHTAKCVIEFETSFWRKEGLSGFVYSPIGPLGEMHDACTQNKSALFGFLLSNASTHTIQADVKAQMKRLFPTKKVKNIFFVDWREEEFSSSANDRKGLSSHPEYGHSLTHFSSKLFFIGTESSYDNGGYLEGAVISAKQLAEKLKLVL